MTLIETMIVVAITGLMIGMMMFGFGTSRQAEVLRALNQVTNVVRFGYDKARVSGAYHRLVIDMEKGSFALQVSDGKMYLPAKDRDGRVLEFDESKERRRADRDARAAEAYNRSAQAQAFGARGAEGDDDSGTYSAIPKTVPRRRPPLFESFDEDKAVSGLAAPIVLPEGIKIIYVRTADDVQPITKGEASVFFFPRGRTQETHIHIEDEQTDAKWTLKIAPLTGRVVLDEGHEPLKLPSDPRSETDDLGRRQDRRTF